MKIGLVQYNPIIGDFDYNCAKMLERAAQACESGCDLIIFPELSISGYPPQDLLERDIFLRDHEKSLNEFVKGLPVGVDVLFGAFETREGGGAKHLFNSAFGVRDGKVVYKVRKQLLPTYDVFDESRYFTPGESTIDEPFFITACGESFGVTICEDVWSEEVDEYSVDPVEQIRAKAERENITLAGVINISASPFQRSKEGVRRALFKGVCNKLNAPFIYCNQVGGQDSLIFDGGSTVFDSSGTPICVGKTCVEDLVIYDTESSKQSSQCLKLQSVEESVYEALILGVKDYVNKCGFSSVVLGLSGGIDSALTAAIAVDALGADKVLGVAMPSQYSSDGSLTDAEQLATNLGCRFEVIPIKDLYDSFETSLSSVFEGCEEDVTEQNLQARIRGNLLMAFSNKFNRLLLTTGNKSEMAVGYCTLYGDMNGGLAVISDVPKQLVYSLAEYVNRDGERIPKNTIVKPPSAELKPDQCDQDDLPDYDILDSILDFHLELGLGVEEIVEKGYDKIVVEDIVRRVRLNEYKRKQAPMGLKVTSKAFGYGRRFPNVQNFRK